MTDEEKKVIEKTKLSLKILENNKSSTNVFYDISDLTALVNLIERLEKKNKRYEKIIEHKDKKCEELLEFVETEKETEYIHKDKIKAKIETLEKLQKEFPNNKEIRIKIIAYKELLEEKE